MDCRDKPGNDNYFGAPQFGVIGVRCSFSSVPSMPRALRRVLVGADHFFRLAQFWLGLAAVAGEPDQRGQRLVDAEPIEQFAIGARVVGCRPIDFADIARAPPPARRCTAADWFRGRAPADISGPSTARPCRICLVSIAIASLVRWSSLRAPASAWSWYSFWSAKLSQALRWAFGVSMEKRSGYSRTCRPSWFGSRSSRSSTTS